jgi:hypothetical protein
MIACVINYCSIHCLESCPVPDSFIVSISSICSVDPDDHVDDDDDGVVNDVHYSCWHEDLVRWIPRGVVIHLLP